MICERCEKEFTGAFYQMVFVKDGKPVKKKICKDCQVQMMKRMGEKECPKPKFKY